MSLFVSANIVFSKTCMETLPTLKCKEHNENEHNEQVGCQLDVQHQDHSVSISIHAKSIPSNLKPNLLLYNLKSIFSRIHINLMYVVYC